MALRTLTGTSVMITALNAEIDRIGQSDARVLITGESGAGKEVVARAIVAASPRDRKPFVPVNCAGIPETLLQSELFGYVKGSFTGAYRDQAGKLEAASGGTLFLDEIGEMSLQMQALFLRFLETGEIQKIGVDHIVRAADIRVIAATNRDLYNRMIRGYFREDLFYRLNVVHLHVPALREHREDIPILVNQFLRAFTSPDAGSPYHRPRVAGPPVRHISPEAMTQLMEYPWPGNVRELENVIERIIIMARHEVIQPVDLPIELRGPWHNGIPPGKERRRSVADKLYSRLVGDRESFWTVVYPLYRDHAITKDTLRELVGKGLYEARGNYKLLLELFNMKPSDYKRFLNFLTTHDCRLPYREYRFVRGSHEERPSTTRAGEGQGEDAELHSQKSA